MSPLISANLLSKFIVLVIRLPLQVFSFLKEKLGRAETSFIFKVLKRADPRILLKIRLSHSGKLLIAAVLVLTLLVIDLHDHRHFITGLKDVDCEAFRDSYSAVHSKETKYPQPLSVYLKILRGGDLDYHTREESAFEEFSGIEVLGEPSGKELDWTREYIEAMGGPERFRELTGTERIYYFPEATLAYAISEQCADKESARPGSLFSGLSMPGNSILINQKDPVSLKTINWAHSAAGGDIKTLGENDRARFLSLLVHELAHQRHRNRLSGEGFEEEWACIGKGGYASGLGRVSMEEDFAEIVAKVTMAYFDGTSVKDLRPVDGGEENLERFRLKIVKAKEWGFLPPDVKLGFGPESFESFNC